MILRVEDLLGGPGAARVWLPAHPLAVPRQVTEAAVDAGGSVRSGCCPRAAQPRAAWTAETRSRDAQAAAGLGVALRAGL